MEIRRKNEDVSRKVLQYKKRDHSLLRTSKGSGAWDWRQAARLESSAGLEQTLMRILVRGLMAALGKWTWETRKLLRIRRSTSGLIYLPAWWLNCQDSHWSLVGAGSPQAESACWRLGHWDTVLAHPVEFSDPYITTTRRPSSSLWSGYFSSNYLGIGHYPYSDRPHHHRTLLAVSSYPTGEKTWCGRVVAVHSDRPFLGWGS